MRTSKGLISLVAVGAVSLLAMSACNGGSKNQAPTQGSFADCATSPNTCNSGATKQGGAVTYTIEKKITGWNLNDNDSNTFDFQEVLDGVLPVGPFIANPDFNVVLNTDFVTSADVTSTSPETIVYKIRPEAVWSDGTPIDVNDFIYAWKTQDGTDCPDCNVASTAGYEDIQSVTGADNGKTVTVVFKNSYSDWKGLFGNLYPQHLAAQGNDLTTDKGLNDSFNAFNGDQPPTWSGGPYIISDYQKDVSVTEKPNPKWYGATKPSLDKLVFRIITDQTQEVPALTNGEVNVIYPQPNQDIVTGVKALTDVQSNLGQGLTWEHLDLNTTNPFLKDVALRTAIFTAVSRTDIISKTVGQFVPGLTPLNSHNFVPGQAGYKDEVTSSGQGVGDPAKAKAGLTAAGYTWDSSGNLMTKDGKAVTLSISYTNGNTLRQQTCELIQSELKAIGIPLTINPIQSLGKTLAGGGYDLIIFAWVGTPFPYSGAIQLWGTGQGGNYNKFSDPQVDSLLKDAAGQSDSSKANDDLNQADQILTAAAVVLPLFQKPTFLAADKNIANIRDNASSVGPPYLVQQWGIRATS
jgi:peptide/nickel transport system substrate-binding protein